MSTVDEVAPITFSGQQYWHGQLEPKELLAIVPAMSREKPRDEITDLESFEPPTHKGFCAKFRRRHPFHPNTMHKAISFHSAVLAQSPCVRFNSVHRFVCSIGRDLSSSARYSPLHCRLQFPDILAALGSHTPRRTCRCRSRVLHDDVILGVITRYGVRSCGSFLSEAGIRKKYGENPFMRRFWDAFWYVCATVICENLLKISQ